MSKNVKLNPEAWILTRHQHPDYDETIYYDYESALADAELDSDSDLPEGEYHHKPRPLYGEDAIAALEARLATATELLKECREHVMELEEAWRVGVIHEHDGLGGTRSNRNGDLRVKLAAFLEGAK